MSSSLAPNYALVPPIGLNSLLPPSLYVNRRYELPLSIVCSQPPQSAVRHDLGGVILCSRSAVLSPASPSGDVSAAAVHAELVKSAPVAVESVTLDVKREGGQAPPAGEYETGYVDPLDPLEGVWIKFLNPSLSYRYVLSVSCRLVLSSAASSSVRSPFSIQSLYIPTTVQPCSHILALAEYGSDQAYWPAAHSVPFNVPNQLLVDGTAVRPAGGAQKRSALSHPGSLVFFKDDGGKDTNFIEVSVVLRAAPDGRPVEPKDWPSTDLAVSTELLYCNDVDDAFLVAGDEAELSAAAVDKNTQAVSNFVPGVGVCPCPPPITGKSKKVKLPTAPAVAHNTPEGTPNCPIDKLLYVTGKGEKRIAPNGNGRGADILSTKTRCRIENISKNHFHKLFRIKAVPTIAGAGTSSTAGNSSSVRIGPNIVVGCGLTRRIFVKSKHTPVRPGEVASDAAAAAVPSSSPAVPSSSPKPGSLLSSSAELSATPSHPAYVDAPKLPKTKRSRSNGDIGEVVVDAATLKAEKKAAHKAMQALARQEAASMILKEVSIDGLIANAREMRDWGEQTVAYINTLSQHKNTQQARGIGDRFHREIVGKCEEIARMAERLNKLVAGGGGGGEKKRSRKSKEKTDDDDESDITSDQPYMPDGGTSFGRTESEAYYAQSATYDQPLTFGTLMGPMSTNDMPPPSSVSNHPVSLGLLSRARSEGTSTISALLSASNADLGTFNAANFGSFNVSTMNMGRVMDSFAAGATFDAMPPPPTIPPAAAELDRGMSVGINLDPIDAPVLKLGHQISSQYCGLSKSGGSSGDKHSHRTQHTASETLRTFPNAQQAIREKKMGSSVGVDRNFNPPSEDQYSVHYILAKVWCDSVGFSYGLMAFDKGKTPVGFYRDLSTSNKSLIVFVPIADAKFGDHQLAQISQELEVHQAAGSGAVKTLDQSGASGGVGALVENGNKYFLEKEDLAYFRDEFSKD